MVTVYKNPCQIDLTLGGIIGVSLNPAPTNQWIGAACPTKSLLLKERALVGAPFYLPIRNQPVSWPTGKPYLAKCRSFSKSLSLFQAQHPGL